MELKPCPFCTSGDVSRSQGQTGSGDAWQYIECETCGATASPERWNERPSEDEIQANYRYVSVLLGAAERQRDEALSMGTTVGSANPIRQVEQPAGTGHEATPKRSGNPSGSHPSIRRPTPEPQGEAVAWRVQTPYGVGYRFAEELVSYMNNRDPEPQPGEGGGEVSGLVAKWRGEVLPMPSRNHPEARRAAKNYNCALTACADELERALSKGGQGGF